MEIASRAGWACRLAPESARTGCGLSFTVRVRRHSVIVVVSGLFRVGLGFGVRIVGVLKCLPLFAQVVEQRLHLN